MGQSTDAILCFGFELEEGEEGAYFGELTDGSLCRDEEDDEDDEAENEDWADFDTWAARKLGLGYLYDDYSFKSNALKELLQGVTLVRHCSCDYPMYIMAAWSTEASRGFPERVDLNDLLAQTPVLRDNLFQACLKLGLEFKEPSWILCSDWC